MRPQGAGHPSRAPEGRQERLTRPEAVPAAAWWLGAGALAGWALLALGGGGIDLAPAETGGALGAFLALAAGAPLAAAALLVGWRARALRSGPGRLALAAAAGSTAWAALSILWAAAPDLAWSDANRQAIALCALVTGTALGAVLPRAGRLIALGLAAAAVVPVGAALATKILPGVLGEDGELARMSAPLGYWNALALVAVLALPGLLWLAGGERPAARTAPAAAAGVAVVATTVLLTYSRGGVLSLLMAAGVTVAVLPRRGPGVAALLAGAAGAALPAAHALTDPALSTDGLPAALREGAGAGLGWRLALGMAVAALITRGALEAVRRRPPADPRRAARRAAATGAALVLIGAVAVAATPAGRDWAGDRVAELRGEGGDAVANDPARLVSASGNQRLGWWGEAWRGFADAPLTGQGAGGFALVHLAEREVGDDLLNTREPHGVVLRVLSGTGLVGLALFAALVAAVAWAALRAGGRGAGPETGLPLAMLAAVILQAAVDWTWAVPALTVPAFAAAGVVLAAADPGLAPGRRRPGRAAAAAVAAVTLAAVFSAALPWWSARLTASGEDALAAGRERAALRQASDAHAANPLSVAPLLLRARAYDALGQPARALGALHEATRLQPDNPMPWRALAVFLGPDRRAVAAWREVRRLDPQDPEAALRG